MFLNFLQNKMIRKILIIFLKILFWRKFRNKVKAILNIILIILRQHYYKHFEKMNNLILKNLPCILIIGRYFEMATLPSSLFNLIMWGYWKVARPIQILKSKQIAVFLDKVLLFGNTSYNYWRFSVKIFKLKNIKLINCLHIHF